MVSCEKNLRFASISDDSGRYDEIVTVKREHRVRHANHCSGTNRTLRAFQRGKSPDYALVRRSGLFDLGRMEGFRGTLKRKCYYGRRFTSRESLVQTTERYIDYYNNQRIQRNLGILTPMEMRTMKLAA